MTEICVAESSMALANPDPPDGRLVLLDRSAVFPSFPEGYTVGIELQGFQGGSRHLHQIEVALLDRGKRFSEVGPDIFRKGS